MKPQTRIGGVFRVERVKGFGASGVCRGQSEAPNPNLLGGIHHPIPFNVGNIPYPKPYSKY